MRGKRKGRIVLSLFMTLLLTLSVTACGKSYEAITKDSFAKAVSAEKFSVTDQSSMIKDDSNLEVVYLAQPKDKKDTKKSDEKNIFSGQYQVEYYKFDKADSCEKSYDKIDDELVSTYKSADGYKTTDKSSGDYAKRVVDTKERHYVVMRVKDSLVIAISPADKADTIDKIVDSLTK